MERATEHFVTIWFQNRRAKDKRLIKTTRHNASKSHGHSVEALNKPGKPKISLSGDISDLIEKTAEQNTTDIVVSELSQASDDDTPTSVIGDIQNKSSDCELGLSYSGTTNYNNEHIRYTYKTETEKCHKTSASSRQPGASPAYEVFHHMVSMAAVAEGGIIQPTDTGYDDAVNAALYGLTLSGHDRLLYDTNTGFYVQDNVKSEVN